MALISPKRIWGIRLGTKRPPSPAKPRVMAWEALTRSVLPLVLTNNIKVQPTFLENRHKHYLPASLLRLLARRTSSTPSLHNLAIPCYLALLTILHDSMFNEINFYIIRKIIPHLSQRDNSHSKMMGATVALVARTKSSGASTSCIPRCPALTAISSHNTQVSSMNTG